MLAKILLFLTSLYLKYTASAGSASAENPQLIDFLATGLVHCPIENWNCEGDTIKSTPNLESWEDCGRECEHYAGCEYWTYTYYYYFGSRPVCFLKTSCKGGTVSYGSKSGSKFCPTVVCPPWAESRIDSCGKCSVCIGACVFGVCVGPCFYSARLGSSLQEACLQEVASLATNNCSSECAQGGETACQDCISNGGTAECAETSLFPCFKCVIAVGEAVYKCVKEFHTPAKVLECIIDNVPASCADCACSIACKLHRSLCPLCPV